MTLIKKQVNTLVVKSVSISYPPLKSSKGTPFLSQNRQFQWTNTGNVIYPVIPAYAATLLKKQHIKVFWDDAIVQNLTYQQWLEQILENKPHLIAIETKTPVIKQHWKIINELKQKSLTVLNWRPIIVLMGDHVTALSEESIKNSKVDYILVGGDYDFLLDELIQLINSGKKPKNKIFKSKNNHDLNTLPIIDRELTQWQLYAYNNTNYKYKPGAYIMSGRDCWWGKCTFCSWTTLYPSKCYRSFSVKHTLNEISNLVNNFGVKEIFDDSGTLPVGAWLSELCHQLINTGLNKKITLGCNMRFGALNQDQYNLMKQAGFRFILYGLESANQSTLDKINKHTTTADARKTLIMAKKAGLEPHITVMIGYPWENINDANCTLQQAKTLFRDGLVDSMQATLIIPYPGTPLFNECQQKNLLLTENWDNYDMRQPVIKSSIPPEQINKLINSLFKTALEPKFLLRKIFSIRSYDDVKFLSTYALKFIKKLNDFN